jgi:diguanylate cyclase (GGDEF)-like protein
VSPGGVADGTASGLLPARISLRFAAFGGLGVVAFVLAPAGNELILLGFGLAGVAATWVGLACNLPRETRPWRWVAAGISLWILGRVLLNLGDTPSAQVLADVTRLAAYPLVGIGLHGLARARSAGRGLAELIDAATVAAALALMIHVFLATELLAATDLSAWETGVGLSFLLGDVLLLAGFVRVAISPGSWHFATWLLLAALLFRVGGDVIRLGLPVYGIAVPAWNDALYLMVYVAVGSAALHPSMVRLTERAERDRYWVPLRLTVAGISAMLPLVILIVQRQLGNEPSLVTGLVGLAVIVVLLLLRQQLAFDRVQEVKTQAVELRDQLAFEAAHDALTLLPNRSNGLVLIRHALERARREGGVVTVMFLDLDGFKQVNDTLGHRAGDQLLRRVADRLQRSTRGSDVAIRLGGDEFVLLLETLPDPRTALQVADRVIATVAQPVHLGPLGSARVGASIGIAQCLDGTADAETLLHEADVAAYRAKRQGKGRSELFDAALREELRSHERLAAELRRAIDGDELVLHYQPVIDSMSGAVRGYEALVRWQHPRLGLLQPGEFLPVAESFDVVCDLDRWVLHRATDQLHRWVTKDGFDHLVVAVNISISHAARTRLVDDVRDALAASGLRPDRLVLELPERVLDDLVRAVPHLQLVRDLGVSVSVSDFGSGVSALGRLASLPVNVVKIGRASLDLDSPLGDRLLKLMVQGAHAVGLNAVAEGVEHDEQLAVLRSLDCEMVQGFHIARPMPADEVVAYHHGQQHDRFSGLRH